MHFGQDVGFSVYGEICVVCTLVDHYQAPGCLSWYGFESCASIVIFVPFGLLCKNLLHVSSCTYFEMILWILGGI